MKHTAAQKPRRRASLLLAFLLGVLSSALLLSALPALGAAQEEEEDDQKPGMRDIQAWVGGITIYLNKQRKVPQDANGKEVDPMIYEGTTYVPLRAVGNMLGLEVGWDAATKSVYLGEQPGRKTWTMPGELLDEWAAYYTVKTGVSASFQILGETFNPSNAIKIWNDTPAKNIITWKLNSEYRALDASYVMAYNNLGLDGAATLEFYSVDQYGTETLLGSYSSQCGDGPTDVHLDVTACDFLRVKYSMQNPNFSAAVLYNIVATAAG